MKPTLWIAAFLFLSTSALAGISPPAGAATTPTDKPELHYRVGPLKIDLGHYLVLDLPADYAYLPMPDADRLMQKLGNLPNPDRLGLIVGTDDNSKWIATLFYADEGYVKDNEKLDADEILKSLRDSMEEHNKERNEHGLKPYRIDGWKEPPHYDRALHHMIWGLLLSEEDGGITLNYNTRKLGRHGYLSLNLLTEPAQLDADRPHAARLLAAINFKPSARYADFDKKKDKVAKYGLIGLILGGAGLVAIKAAKVGFLAAFFKPIVGLLLALKKVLVLLVLAIVGFFKKLFSGKKDDPPSTPKTPPSA